MLRSNHGFFQSQGWSSTLPRQLETGKQFYKTLKKERAGRKTVTRSVNHCFRIYFSNPVFPLIKPRQLRWTQPASDNLTSKEFIRILVNPHKDSSQNMQSLLIEEDSNLTSIKSEQGFWQLMNTENIFQIHVDIKTIGNWTPQ